MLLFAGAGALVAAAPVTAASLVVDAKNRTVLHDDNAGVRWYPASLTKVMTAFLVYEAIDDGRTTLDTGFSVTAAAARQPPTKIGLGIGQRITVRRALEATIIRSANDAAVALAIHIAGSESAFAQRMTEKARSLGMTATVFRNATGLPDDAQTTTARDMAILALAFRERFPERAALFSKRSMTYGGRSLPTFNPVLGSVVGADGMKTGFTCASGYNLLATAHRNGRSVIAVLLGAKSRQQRLSDVITLLDKGLDPAAGETGSGQQLIELANAPASLPPTVLSGARCGTGVASPGYLPGWGVLLGAYPSTSKAQRVLANNQGRVGGTARILRQKTGGRGFYNALLVGLSGNQAQGACKKIWTRDQYCLALNPKALNNPNAIWR